jgi:hypothetical protein
MPAHRNRNRLPTGNVGGNQGHGGRLAGLGGQPGFLRKGEAEPASAARSEPSNGRLRHGRNQRTDRHQAPCTLSGSSPEMQNSRLSPSPGEALAAFDQPPDPPLAAIIHPGGPMAIEPRDRPVFVAIRLRLRCAHARCFRSPAPLEQHPVGPVKAFLDVIEHLRRVAGGEMAAAESRSGRCKSQNRKGRAQGSGFSGS